MRHTGIFLSCRVQPLRLLKSVERKLVQVLDKGSGSPINPNISFHIPTDSFSASTKESALWMLGNVGLSSEEEVEDDEVILCDNRPEKLLLKTKFLTTSSSTTTQELRVWGSADPSMKKVNKPLLDILDHVLLFFSPLIIDFSCRPGCI